MASQENRIVIGRIGSPYGVKGWLRIHSFTNPLENITDYSPWYIHYKGQWITVEIEAIKPQGKTFIAKIKDCDDRTFAQTYTNIDITIDRTQLPNLENDDYYWVDLEGLMVINQNNQPLGTIDHLFATGANDVMLVKGEQEYLIPYVKQIIVKSVDLDKKIMRVEWEPDY